MKSPLCLAIISVSLSAALPVARAQSAGNASPTASAAAAAAQQAFLNSRVLFAGKNFAQAEAALEAGNRQKPGTPQWNVESASALTRVAFEFQEKGDGATALEAAQRALQQLALAGKKFGAKDKPAEIAAMYELAGLVSERFIGDVAAAETNYSMAVSLAPNSGKAAVMLARLQAQDAAEKRKAHK